MTRAPDADVALPIEQRVPGGLGLHLIRRLVDAVEYDYSEAARRSRITFRKTGPDATRRPAEGGGGMLTIEPGAEGVVVVAGRLDAAQAPAAQAFLDGVAGVVTLDCSRLEYISSAGLGVLLKTQKRLLGAGASCGLPA